MTGVDPVDVTMVMTKATGRDGLELIGERAGWAPLRRRI
jgi:hypothetical protein